MPIKVLPPEVVAQIAAGEVVERPASVVKELIENSLDAGATAISVEIRNGGLALIRVSDNGCGIPRDELPLVLERYATSKIATLEDIKAIKTLGFRGEALSSIAAVAHMEILTRTAAEIEGSRLRLEDDKPCVEPAASPVGTQVTVRNLFHNTPARRKFLKSPLRETELIRNVVVRYALGYPEVAFRLVVDGKEKFVAPPAGPLERIAQALGRDVASEMVPIGWEAGDIEVEGFISRPTIGRSNREGQFFFLNGRPIRAGLLAVMLERPYTGRIPPGRKPLAVVHIHVAPHLVDVNVHPRKAEVRLAQERAVYYALTKAVEEALAPYPCAEGIAAISWPFEDTGGEVVGLREARAEYVTGRAKVLGQVGYTYIIAHSPEGLLIVDQHAAHEQVLFERILSGRERYPINPPSYVELTLGEVEILEPHVPLLDELGLELEPFGKTAFLMRSVPYRKLPLSPEELLEKLAVELKETARLSQEALREKLAMRLACLGAVKRGDILTPEQMQALVDELMSAWSPSACPHGRPAFVLLGLDEIERRFLRR